MSGRLGRTCLASVLDFLYPPRCPICEAVRLPEEDICCPECRKKLVYTGKTTCYQCGKPVADMSIEYCYDCTKKRRSFERGYSVFIYEDSIRESMMGFKFLEKEWRGDFYVEELFRAHGKELLEQNADCIIPVPIHRKKFRLRGYNQAEVLARGLSEKLGIPVWDKLLLRNRYTIPQKKLNDVERLRNLLKAFELDEKEASLRLNKRKPAVILIDDIYTTGSTLEACSRILKKAGVRDITVVTICIGSGY